MGEIFETAATLRFLGHELDPDELTAVLGAMPSMCVRKGAIWSTSNGKEIVARTGSWRLDAVRRRPGDLDGQIAELLQPLTSDLSAWKRLAERFRAEMFCGVFLGAGNQGLSLAPETLGALQSRRLKLDLDIYAPGSG